MVHAKKKDKNNIPINVKASYNIIMSLKCKEKGKYVLKKQSQQEMKLTVSETYDIHNAARKLFEICNVHTFLGSYRNLFCYQ